MQATKADIGIVLCDCGGTLNKQLDIDKIQEKLSQIKTVNKVKICSQFCAQKECSKAIKSLLNNTK